MSKFSKTEIPKTIFQNIQNIFSFEGQIWQTEGQVAWFFVSLPTEISQEIIKNFAYLKQGWGSIQVRASLQELSWQTSIFPDKKSQTHVLPLKAQIRRAKSLRSGDKIQVGLEILFGLGI